MARSKTRTKKWSAAITKHKPPALDVPKGLFKSSSATKIAKGLLRAAEKSKHRHSTPYRAAMSMLNFYINRAGINLSRSRLIILDRAKRILHTYKPQLKK